MTPYHTRTNNDLDAQPHREISALPSIARIERADRELRDVIGSLRAADADEDAIGYLEGARDELALASFRLRDTEGST